MQITYGPTAHSRNTIKNFVLGQKSRNPGYRVIDIGGSHGGWTTEFADTIVDIKTRGIPGVIALDICIDDQWSILYDQVKKGGKFDFAICTHTLEDVYNPFTALSNLPKIAEAGVITMPSLRAELARPENPAYLGYIHHRWIFDEVNGVMVVLPKLSFLEKLVGTQLGTVKPRWEDVIFEWTGKIDYRIFMDNYLGPDVQTVVNTFTEHINQSLPKFT